MTKFKWASNEDKWTFRGLIFLMVLVIAFGIFTFVMATRSANECAKVGGVNTKIGCVDPSVFR